MIKILSKRTIFAEISLDIGDGPLTQTEMEKQRISPEKYWEDESQKRPEWVKACYMLGEYGVKHEKAIESAYKKVVGQPILTICSTCGGNGMPKGGPNYEEDTGAYNEYCEDCAGCGYSDDDLPKKWVEGKYEENVEKYAGGREAAEEDRWDAEKEDRRYDD